MYKKSILLTTFLLALSGCGSPALDPIDSDVVFDETMVCTGLSASKPNIEFIDDAIWPFGKDTAGHYKSDAWLVLIKSSRASNYDVLVHEFIHHLLAVNNGYVDTCHSSSLFKQCAPSTAGYSC